jgi:NAD(P)-dependent dehydrogenase (short-subunit alcohol dehydrogenase family)
MKKVGAAVAALALGRVAMEVNNRRRAVRLRGATAVVCGASRGLGRAIAFELGRRGVARIGICARREHDLDGVASELVKMGVHVCAEACDLSRTEEVERFLGSTCARLGQIDVLVTNAATMTLGPVETMSKQDFDDALSSIFYTTLNPVLEVLPSMKQRRRGTIAVITSIGARIGVPHLAPYCAAKAAVMGLAESLRAEVAKDGVHILTVVPGLMRTGSHVHAQIKGDHDLEYAWFGSSATAPVLSIDADRAARRIVSAIARGRAELAFTPEARIAPAVRTLAPGFWSEMIALAARFLPGLPPEHVRANEPREGVDIESTSESRVVQAVRERGREAVEKNAQVHRRIEH